MTLQSSSWGWVLDTVNGEVAYYHAAYNCEEWHRCCNMATLLNAFVINLARGKDWPPDSSGIHTPDPDYHSNNGP